MHEAKLKELFAKNFEERGELGASLSVWKDGEEILSLSDGSQDKEKTRPWSDETIAPVWSATKGPAALALLLALHENKLRINDPVKKIWPELKGAANSNLTFAQLLSHQSGLAALSPGNRGNMLNHTVTVAALEAQEPFWEPGKGHGYHPRTIGFLYDELVRRLTSGLTLGKFWNRVLAPKLGVEFWIGDLPVVAMKRLARMVPPRVQRPPEEEIPFYRELAKSDSLALGAFSSPAGMKALSDINKLEYLQIGLPALGGVGTATGLAKIYQILAQDGIADGVQVLPKSVVASARALQTSGDDLTLILPTAFTCGFMKDPVDHKGKKLRSLFGPNHSAFGQPGAGGSHAFADPETGISFAYIMNQMESGVLPNRKSLDLVDAVYEGLNLPPT